jgi:hypothetical protein
MEEWLIVLIALVVIAVVLGLAVWAQMRRRRGRVTMVSEPPARAERPR